MVEKSGGGYVELLEPAVVARAAELLRPFFNSFRSIAECCEGFSCADVGRQAFPQVLEQMRTISAVFHVFSVGHLPDLLALYSVAPWCPTYDVSELNSIARTLATSVGADAADATEAFAAPRLASLKTLLAQTRVKVDEYVSGAVAALNQSLPARAPAEPPARTDVDADNLKLFVRTIKGGTKLETFLTPQ